MHLNIATVIISVVLFFVLFFGIGFILNMLLRQSWVMVVLYPLVVLYFINGSSYSGYISNTVQTFGQFSELKLTDMIILTAGFSGALASGLVIRLLRRRGYQMF